MATWNCLLRSERKMLVHHFLADGITQMAFSLAFLPQYFANARANDAVGFHRALLALIDLLEVLFSSNSLEQADMMTVEVDLSELANFTKDVRFSRDFELIAERLTLATVGGLVQPQLQKRVETTIEMERSDQAAHVTRRMIRYFD